MDLLGDIREKRGDKGYPYYKVDFKARKRYAPALLLGRLPSPLRIAVASSILHQKAHKLGMDDSGILWLIGWIFTIGYFRLSFWRGVLALIIWPYYIGVHVAGKFHNAK